MHKHKAKSSQEINLSVGVSKQQDLFASGKDTQGRLFPNQMSD